MPGVLGTEQIRKDEKMKESIAKMRAKIPRKNLPSYDATARAVLEVLETDPERHDEMADFLWDRTQQLQARDLSMIPPALPPLSWETINHRIDREYAVHCQLQPSTRIRKVKAAK